MGWDVKCAAAAQRAAVTLVLLMLLMPSGCSCTPAKLAGAAAVMPRRWMLQTPSGDLNTNKTATAVPPVLDAPALANIHKWLAALLHHKPQRAHAAAASAEQLLSDTPHTWESFEQLYLAANSSTRMPHMRPGDVSNTSIQHDLALLSDVTPSAAYPAGIIEDLQGFCQGVGNWMSKCNKGVKVMGYKVGSVCSLAKLLPGGASMTQRVADSIKQATSLCACMSQVKEAFAAAGDLFSSGSSGSLNNFKVEAVKAIGNAAACLMRNGWNIQNNREVI
jgi:hypothetical protein